MYNFAEDDSTWQIGLSSRCHRNSQQENRAKTMHQEIPETVHRRWRWGQNIYRLCLLGMVCFALVCMEGMIAGVPTAHADGVPGGNISDPVVRAVDIAKPAIVRIITEELGILTVTFSNNKTVTFPQTPQNGVNGYALAFSGTGAFISAHGDILTADHVVNAPKTDLDQGLYQLAATDVANYINQNLKPAQPATSDQVIQNLTSGQLLSTSQYQGTQSRVFLSTDYTGSVNASSLQSIPTTQYADVDQIKQQSATDQSDVAIIHVSGMDDMAMLQLGNSSGVQPQDQLRIIGFPGNGDVNDTNPTDFLTSSINEVLVSSIKTTPSGAPVIQVGGNVEHGDSGGPALDSSGNVVGIVSFGLSDTGSTSFLQASNSALQLIQAANISTTPSAFQQSWSQAFKDYASTSAGHWHKATQELQQIATSYPRFKSVTPFLQYASQQARTETQTQNSVSNGSSSTGISALSSLSPIYIIIGGVFILLLLIVIGVLVSRRKKPAVVTPGYNAVGQNYNNFSGATPGYSSTPGQNIPGTPPQNPLYQSRPGYPQPQQPSVIQPGYPQPQQVRPASPGGISAFGAPSSPVPPQSAGASQIQPNAVSPEATLLRSGHPGNPNSVWSIWPCGHTNRYDARFCGICGDPAPPLSARRDIQS